MALLDIFSMSRAGEKCTCEVTKEIENKSSLAFATKLAVNGSLSKWRLVTSCVHIGAILVYYHFKSQRQQDRVLPSAGLWVTQSWGLKLIHWKERMLGWETWTGLGNVDCVKLNKVLHPIRSDHSAWAKHSAWGNAFNLLPMKSEQDAEK